jgi:outer membrane lipoprotein-sorting protein
VKIITVLKIRLFLVLLLLVQAGCLKTTKNIPANLRLLPAKTANKAELLQGLEESSNQVQTFKSGMLLDLSTGGPKSGVLNEYRETRGAIAVSRGTNHMLMKVLAPLVLTTLATMVSDGTEYRVSIPLKNQYAVGNVNAPLSSDSSLNNLRPKIIMEGLFVDVRPYLKKTQFRYLFEEAVQGTHSYYVIGFVHDVSGEEAEYVEKLWIDRSEDLQVTRKQIFGKDGKLETDVQYQNYQLQDGIPFPQTVVISRPAEDYTVKMTFTSRTFNEAIPDEVFNLPRPDGSQLVQLTK